MNDKNNEFRLAAMKYLSKGWSVIPVSITTILDNDGKVKKIPQFPLSWKKWETEFMPILELETYWPEYTGIAIVTGKLSNVTVIDVDILDLPEMATLPPTYTVKTNKGFHFFYQYNKDIKQIQNNGTHVDIRNDGGLIFAPPTKYKLPNGAVAGYNISQDLPVAPFPVDWYDSILKVNNAIQESKGIAHKGIQSIVGGVNGGSRNNSAASMAGSLLLRYPQKDWQSIAWPLLCAWNQQNKPALDSQELIITWNSICSKEKARQLTGDVFGEATIVEIPGGWSVNFTFELGLIYFNFTNFENGSDRKEAIVSILVELKDKKAGLALTQRFNLISVSARGQVVTQLNSAFGKDIKWSLLLSNAIEYILAKQVIIQSIEVDFTIPYKETPFLLFPFVEENAQNMLFGDGESGKTMLTLKIGLCIAFDKPFLGLAPSVSAQTNKNVLFIDYENNENTFIMRCKALMPDIPLADLSQRMFYFAGQMPLHEHESHLQKLIFSHKIGLIIIDSAAAASGGAAEDSVIANRYLTLLRRLNIASLTIAHQSKGTDGKTPFGSIFWRNGCRNIWYAKKNEDNMEINVIDVLLRHNKANNFQRQREHFAEIKFINIIDDNFNNKLEITIEPGDRSTWESELNIRERILLLLEQQAMTVKELAEETGSKQSTIRGTLKRLADKSFIEKIGEKWQKCVTPKYVDF